MSYRILGYGYTWWRGDPLPDLPPLSGFSAAPTNDYPLVAALAQLDVGELLRRVQRSHCPYVAYLEGRPIAYGWSAAKVGAIHELGLAFTIPASNRYLWDFATLPAWRGRGVYPHLLQAMLAYEGAAAQRFWIGHTAENMASRRGISKAGFRPVEALVVAAAGRLKILGLGPTRRAEVSPLGLRLGVLLADRCEER